MLFKPLLRDLLPPLLVKQIRKCRQKYGWYGDYRSWELAAAESCGYGSERILERVLDATSKVKSGVAVYERDSVLFSEIQYSWPLLAGLMHIAAANAGCLRLIDFGGSLGSSYFQNRAFLQGLLEVRWCVVEQEHFVRCGREKFEDPCLRFYSAIDECLGSEQPDAIILSGVLPYLPAPYDQVNEIIRKGFGYILIDRTGFSRDGRHRITLQKVDPAIYPASYPCHFFSRESFRDCFEKRYQLMAEFEALGDPNYPAEFLGFIYRLKYC